MNEREINEIRRHYRPDKCNVGEIHGCYINENKEIISEFSQSLALLGEDDKDKILSTIKKSLSGTLGKNIINVEFSTQQVTNSDEHKLLMKLRDTELKDKETLHAFYEKIAATVNFESNYTVLLASDIYDVPSYSKDGENEGSSSQFRYILCSICPIKISKPSLTFKVNENKFATLSPDWLITSPEIGFMFPSFDKRSTNIYEALFYAKNVKNNYQDFATSIFASNIPMPAAAQKESFELIMSEAIAEECNYNVVDAVHGQLCEIIEEHKLSKDPEPLVIDKNSLNSILSSSGVTEEKITAFNQKFDEQFGAGSEISPKNVVNTKKFELTTPDITIKINPEKRNLVETKVIDGEKYILVKAEGSVEINGIEINI